MMAFRIAYCKVHYPLAYYAAYFSIRAETFDANVIVEGQDRIQKEIDEISKRIESKQTNPKDEETVIKKQRVEKYQKQCYT